MPSSAPTQYPTTKKEHEADDAHKKEIEKAKNKPVNDLYKDMKPWESIKSISLQGQCAHVRLYTDKRTGTAGGDKNINPEWTESKTQ